MFIDGGPLGGLGCMELSPKGKGGPGVLPQSSFKI